MMGHQYLQELDVEQFDAEEFVERLAWRLSSIGPNISGTVGAHKADGYEFDSVLLYKAFSDTIEDLEYLLSTTSQKCDKLVKSVQTEESEQWYALSKLQERNKNAFTTFNELDERINFVATKVVHLGDQLQSINVPRSRAVEAQKLMNYFAEFLSPGPIVSEVFNDPNKLSEAADVIHKLYLIAQELNPKKFSEVRDRISKKYDEVERGLIEEFVKCHRVGNLGKMRVLAYTLSHFKGYHQCIDAFIEQSQLGALNRGVFKEALPLCEKNHEVIKEVFSRHEQVMGKFVLNIYSGKLQEHVQSMLGNKSDAEKYLKNLSDLYTKTLKLSNDLSKFKMGTDSTFLNKLTHNIFQRYLETYISVEIQFVSDKTTGILGRFYESKGHQKRNFSGIDCWKRDIQAAMANMNIGLAVENFEGETLLSEEVAINLLQETKNAFKRCLLLSKPSELASNGEQILKILFQNLLMEHLEYGLAYGLMCIPPSEPKSVPEIFFFDSARQCNSVMHLFEKQFVDSVLPLIISTPKHGECLQRKKALQNQMEQKLDLGLERTITAITGWIKCILQTEQKKTDFKPEGEELAQTSVACTKVCKFLSRCLEKIQDCLDGQNLERTLTELGVRFHRVLFDHLQQFQYSTSGAMCVLCDLNEYRKRISDFKLPFLSTLFDTLNQLCKVLVVQPENLKQVCYEGQLTMLDRSIITNFVHLRADFKVSRLGLQLKGKEVLS